MSYEIALKRDSRYSKEHREKLVGAKLYRKNIEPVLELCTDCGGAYEISGWQKATLGAPIIAQEYECDLSVSGMDNRSAQKYLQRFLP